MNAEIAAFAAECRKLIDEHSQNLREQANQPQNKGTAAEAMMVDRANDMTLIANAISRAGSIHRD